MLYCSLFCIKTKEKRTKRVDFRKIKSIRKSQGGELTMKKLLVVLGVVGAVAGVAIAKSRKCEGACEKETQVEAEEK